MSLFSVVVYFAEFLLVSIIILIGYIKYKASRVYNLKTKQRLTIDLYSTWKQFIEFIQRKTSARERFTEIISNKKDVFALAPFGRLVFAVTHPDDIKKLLSSSDFDKPSMGLFQTGHTKAVLGTSLITSTGPSGWEHRKALNPAFTFSKIKNLVEPFVVSTEKLIKHWELLVGQYFDVHPWFRNFTFDVLGITSFGYDFKSMIGESPQKTDLDAVFNGFIRPQDFITAGFTYQIPTPDVVNLKKVTRNSNQLIFEVINKRIEDRNKGIRGTSDLLDLILDAANTEASSDFKLSTKQIVANMYLFFLAGHETSAGLLTSAMYFLGTKPNLQQQAYEEVVKVLGPNGKPTNENVNDLVFINAILRESLRLNPAIFNVGTREAVKDTEIAGHFIPKGTFIMAPILRAHTSDEFWTNPLEFDPSRFLTGEDSGNSILSFSWGPRICIGHKFSMLEMTIALALLIQHFTWTLQPNFTWKDDPKALTTSPLGGMPVQLKQRL